MGWLFDDAINQAIAWLLAFTARTLNDLWRMLAQSLLTIPDVTALPQVTTISARSQTIVNTCFVLAVIIAGIIVMTRDTLQTRICSRFTTSEVMVASANPAAARARTNPANTSVSRTSSSSGPAGARTSRRSRTTARLNPGPLVFTDQARSAAGMIDPHET